MISLLSRRSILPCFCGKSALSHGSELVTLSVEFAHHPRKAAHVIMSTLIIPVSVVLEVVVIVRVSSTSLGPAAISGFELSRWLWSLHLDGRYLVWLRIELSCLERGV